MSWAARVLVAGLLAACAAPAAGRLDPFFVDFTPEVRSTYVSLGKIVEDAPMQTTFVRLGVDARAFGRFALYNWNVSSLTDRRRDIHRHAIYHTEFGPTWIYGIDLADGWRLQNHAILAMTFFRGYEDPAGEGEYGWVHTEHALVNPYVTPYFYIRRCAIGSDYLHFRVGGRRRCPLGGGVYLTPAVFADGGNARDFKRVVGRNVNGGGWGGGGFSAVTFRLECGWRPTDWLAIFAYVEQYEIVDKDARDATSASASKCAHNDLTIGGVGLSFNF